MMLEILFMKNVVSFWEKRSNYEKAILGLFAAFALCCLGYFGGRLYYGSQCAVCNQELRIGEHYILDVRTGEILCLSDYVDQESTRLWFSSVSRIPQEISLERREGYMRFPRQVEQTARYCSRHASGLGADFLVLSPGERGTICYPVLDGQSLDPEGQVITRRLNDALDCWELTINWDIKTPVLSN